MLWIKTFHIIFVASWFSGLFYLPRIFVNLAMLGEDDEVTRKRLILMSDKLFKFMTILSLPSLILGLILWQFYGLGKGEGSAWMHIKVILVLAIGAYHYYCYKLLNSFRENKNQHSHIWFRWFNEVPVVLMVYVVALVVNKPVEIDLFLFQLTFYFALVVIAFLTVAYLFKRIKSKKN